MSDETELRLRNELRRLNDYISHQRSKYDAEIKSLRASLKDEIKYSTKLRDALDAEYEHCAKLRTQLDERKKLCKDLRDDLDDERKYVEKLEKKLDHREDQIEKLENELYDLEEDYADAYRALKKMKLVKKELQDARFSSKIAKERAEQLKVEIRSLRSMSPASPSRVIVTSSPSIRSSEPHFPRQIPSNVQAQYQHQPSPLSRGNDEESDVSDAEEEGYEDAYDDRQRVATRLSSRHEDGEEEGDESSEVGEGEILVSGGGSPETIQVQEEVYDEDEEDARVVREDEGEPGQHERNLADREMLLADRESQRAREAFDAGDKAFARELKEIAMEHRARARELNRTAAAQIFHSLNPSYHSSTTGCSRIDLHRLFTREALEFVRAHLTLCRARGMRQSEIIVGRGNHSVGGVARLKPAVLEMLEKERDVEVDMSNGNPGSFFVNFLDVPWDARSGTGSGRREGSIRLESVGRAVSDVRQGLDEIERGMSEMGISGGGGGAKGSTRTRSSRNGLRDMTNQR